MSTRLCLNGTNKTEPLTHKHTSVCCGVNKYSVLIYKLLHNSFMLQVNRKSIKMVKENSIVIRTPFVNTCACVCTDAVVVVWQLESWVTQTVVGAHGVLTGSISTRLTLALVHIWTQTTDGQLLWTQTVSYYEHRPQTISYYEHKPQTVCYYEHRPQTVSYYEHRPQTVSYYEHKPQTVSYYEHRPQTG